MTVQIAAILIVGTVVPIATGLWFPRWLLRVFAPSWTAVPPIAITYYYMAPDPAGPGYATTEAVVFPLMVFLFMVVGPWIIWSRAVFHLIRERREGVRRDPHPIPEVRP